MANGLMNVEGL